MSTTPPSARRLLISCATAAALLGSLAGCGDGDKNASAAPAATPQTPCAQLTVAMAKRVFPEPKLGPVSEGDAGCTRQATDASDPAAASSKTSAALLFSMPDLPPTDGSLPADMAAIRDDGKEDRGPDDTLKKLDLGTDGFIATSLVLGGQVLLGWTDGEHHYFLQYNGDRKSTATSVPTDEVIAIAREIQG